MTTTSSFYGKNFNPERVCDLGKMIKKKRCCVGKEYRNVFHKWGVVNDKTFCEYCIKTCFDPSNVTLLKSTTKDTLCYTPFTNISMSSHVHNRVTNHGGLRYNVNILNPDNDTYFVPAVKHGSGLEITDASKAGVHIAILPTPAMYEIVICGDPNHQDYRDDRIFMIEDAKMGDGRKIIVVDKYGHQNIRYNMKMSQTIINSRIAGDPKTRFMFIKCSEKEEQAKLAPEHNKKSNILEFKIGIYREYDEIEYGNSTQGGGVMRGGSCGAPVKAGATLETYGESHYVQTGQTTKQKELLRYETVLIQLMNNETEEILLGESSEIHNDMKDGREKHISELESQLAKGREVAMSHLLHI